MTGAPRLRALRVVPARHAGTSGVVLDDPLGVAPEREFLPLSTWNVARRFDGTRACDEIAAEINATSGSALSGDDVRAVAAELSRRLWLDDDPFARALDVELERFRDRPTRPAVGPGSDYPANATELRIRVAGLVANDWDMPPVARAFGMLGPAGPIDAFAPLYARSWASIRHTAPDRIVVLASAGAPLERPLVPLDRPLETPFGDVPIDAPALRALGIAPGRDVLAHRDALTLERQALFARVLFRGVPLVGLLVGALPGPGATAADEARAREPIAEAEAALARLSELPGRTLFVCASDLFHVGPDSASTLALANGTGAGVRRRDREMLDAAARLDPEAFLLAASADADVERAAWSLAPYLFLRRARDGGAAGSGGSTLGYHQATGPGRLASAASLVVH